MQITVKNPCTVEGVRYASGSQTVSDSAGAKLVELGCAINDFPDKPAMPIMVKINPLTGGLETSAGGIIIPVRSSQYLDKTDFTGYGYKARTRKPAIVFDVIDPSALSLLLWTGGTGTISVSTDVMYEGQPTLKVYMPAACTRVEIGVTSGVVLPSDHIDSLGIGMYAPSLTGLTISQIYIGDSTYTVEQHATFDMAVTGFVGWNHLKFDNRAVAINEGTSTTPGVVTPANATQAKIRINKAAGAASTVYLTAMTELTVSKAKIFFTADDGYDEWYTWLKDQAIIYGVPWALGIDAGYLGTAGFMTKSQVAEMNSMRPDLFQFYSHGTNNHGYGNVGAANYAAEVKATGDMLKGLGVRDPHLYHPYVKGQRGDDLDPLLYALGTRVGRIANGVIGETFKPAVHDRMLGAYSSLKMKMGLSLEAGTTLAAGKLAIDNASAAGGVLSIMAHEFIPDAGTPVGLQWKYGDVIALMAYAKRKERAGLCDVVDAQTLAKIL